MPVHLPINSRTTVRCLALMAFSLAFIMSGCGDLVDPDVWIPNEANQPTGEPVQSGANPQYNNAPEEEEDEDEDEGSALERVLGREGGMLEMQLGEDAILPADFPTDIPLPDGMTLEAVNQLGGNRAFNVMGYSVNSMNTIIEDVQERGSALGWQEDEVLVQSSSTYLATYSKGRRYFQITLRAGVGGRSPEPAERDEVEVEQVEQTAQEVEETEETPEEMTALEMGRALQQELEQGLDGAEETSEDQEEEEEVVQEEPVQEVTAPEEPVQEKPSQESDDRIDFVLTTATQGD